MIRPPYMKKEFDSGDVDVVRMIEEYLATKRDTDVIGLTGSISNSLVSNAIAAHVENWVLDQKPTSIRVMGKAEEQIALVSYRYAEDCYSIRLDADACYLDTLFHSFYAQRGNGLGDIRITKADFLGKFQEAL